MNCYDALASLFPDEAQNPSLTLRLSHLLQASNDKTLGSVSSLTF